MCLEREEFTMNFIQYVKQVWKAGTSGGTPLSPDRLNHIEDGIKSNNDMISELNSNIANSDIEGIFNYLGLELIIYHKLGICYLHSSGRLTQAFPKEWTTIGEISNINYKGYGHLAANTSGKIIKFAYINGTLSAYAPSSTNAIEYVQDSCVLI